jgi:hypothetical protein
MSVKALVVGTIALGALAAPRLAAAQMSSEEGQRFFVDKVEQDGDEDSTLWQGSLISTLFLHREAAGISAPLGTGQVGIENASPLRWFSDLRAQLDARHIAGKSWDARFDGRARLVNTLDSPNNGGAAEVPLQSGSFSGNEFELRELYVVRGSTRTDTYVGRQFVLDVGGLKIDGVRVDYAKNRRWTYLGFAGLYPTRGSRSITTDYPHRVQADGTIESKRVMPAAGGIGAAYRTTRTYGAIGVAGILPLANDKATGTIEQPRLFVSSNGYWRQSPKLDIFHYGIVDITGAAGFAITNLSAGVNYRPQLRLHVEATYNRIDTETLNVQAQTQLEDPDGRNVGVIQNNVTVARIASDSARASVSAALGRTMRWEVTTAASLRQRPEIIVSPVGLGGTSQSIPAARSAEIFFQAVDRHLYRGIRAAASYVRIFAVGTNAARSTSSIVTLAASREIADGKGEWEADLAYLASRDDNAAACDITNLQTCYGSSRVGTVTASGTGFYRLKTSWLLVGTVELARQTLQTLDGGMMTSNPAIISTTAFARIAYRF